MCVVMFGTPNELRLFFRYLAACRSCARMCSQAALMGAIISAMAALDASGGEADVAYAGLDFLWRLADGSTVNKVSKNMFTEVLDLVSFVPPSPCPKST